MAQLQIFCRIIDFLELSVRLSLTQFIRRGFDKPNLTCLKKEPNIIERKSKHHT